MSNHAWQRTELNEPAEISPRFFPDGDPSFGTRQVLFRHYYTSFNIEGAVSQEVKPRSPAFDLEFPLPLHLIRRVKNKGAAAATLEAAPVRSTRCLLPATRERQGGKEQEAGKKCLVAPFLQDD